MLTKRIALFALLQLGILVSLLWIIAGNDKLFRSAVPVHQRLVSRNESIRKKAQQELLGLDAEGKKETVSRLIPALGQEDAFVRKWAAISLALVGPAAQEAIPALLQSVSSKEKDAAQAARVALSEIGAPDAQQLPALLKTLQDPQESVRCEAAHSIGKMGPDAEEAVGVLTAYIRRPSETPACFEDALAALVASLPDRQAGLRPVNALLESGSPVIRRKAAHVLAQQALKSADDAAPVLRALAGEKDPEIRRQLMKALAMPETGEQGVEPVLAAALRGSRSEVVRFTAVESLRRLTPPPADVETIWEKGLSDDSAPIRQSVARWIRESALRGRKPLPLILRMLKDPEPSVRRLGLESLRRSGARSKDLTQTLAKVQRDPDAGVRCRAAEALMEAGAVDRVSTAVLISDLKKDEDTARCAAEVLELAGLFDPDVVRSMMRLIQEEKDIDIRSRAARVLMHLGSRAREAIPALVRAQKDEVPGAALALKAIRAATSKRRI